LSDVFSRRTTAVIAALYLILGLAITQVTLLNTLGYESALLFGLLTAWIGGALPLRLTRAARMQPQADSAGVSISPWQMLRNWWNITLVGWLILIPPVVVLVVNAAFVRNCAMFDGALFWLLIPFMTIAFRNALVLFLRALLGASAGWWYYAILLLFLLQPFVQIFSLPQLYAYNHVFGMFLGVSWDQTQPPFLTLTLFRLSTLAYIVLLLTAATALRTRKVNGPRDVRRRFVLLAAFIPSLAAAIFFLVSSDELGFSNSYTHLRDELGSVSTAGPVTLIYDSSAIDADELRVIMDEHAFQLERVCAELNVQWSGMLTSYLYPDRASKKRLLGTESSEIARPWRSEIHISAQHWRESLKHEIVHVVAGRFGPYISHAPFLRVLGLTEGLAMAVEWSWGNRTLHQHAAAMQAHNILPDARDCISTFGFAGNSSSVSYVASGSFTRWLMDSVGTATIKKAYGEDDVEGVLGVSYEELNRRWRNFLHTIPRAQPDSLATAYAFRRPSIFSAVCPRVVTERSRDAAAAMEDGEPERALQLYREIEALAPNARAVFGIVGAMYQLGMMDSVRRASTRYLRDSSRAFSVYPLLLWKGAAAWAEDDSLAAATAFSDLIREQPPGWPTRLAERMFRAIRSNARDSMVRSVLLGTLRRDRNEDSLRTLRAGMLRKLCTHRPKDAVIFEEYLRLATADSADREEALVMIGEFPLDGMHRSLRMLCAGVLFGEKEYDRAERFFRSALEISDSEMDRLEIDEWLVRCAWLRARLAEKQDVQ
jgi:tetratricopeptide (TPR) repeat protein